jgi:hypothetical protein
MTIKIVNKKLAIFVTFSNNLRITLNKHFDTMQTSKDYTANFRDYGVITVPKGTRLTHQTACGIDKNYHFVCDYNWIKVNYPTIERVLLHDVMYNGIDVPIEFVEDDRTVTYTPLTGQNKPFIMNSQRYNRDELIKLGYDKECHEAILR